MKIIFLGIILILFFGGCSSKKYFEPKTTESGFASKTLESSITFFNKDFANTKGEIAIGRSGIIHVKLKEGFRLINANEANFLAIDTNSTVAIISQETYDEYNLEHQVVAATLKENILAVIFLDNTLALFDIKTKKFLFKEYLNPSLISDVRITNPVFMTDIVLFPTLDGKVVVVSLEKNEKVRDILVDPDGQFNNIIYLKTLDNMLIAATKNKIISLGSGIFAQKELEIVDVVSNANQIYVATLDGKIIAFNPTLEQLGSTKHKYAKIVGLASTDKFIYALESQGYLIQSRKDFSDEKIYSVSLYKSDKIFSNDSNIVIGDTKLILE